MRGPTREELQMTPPPATRLGSKTTQAYLEMRRKILAGDYAVGQVIIPKKIEEEYQVNNTTTQVLLSRLANEGLIRVLPIKERTWPYNASLNEYRVADLSGSHKPLWKKQSSLQPTRITDDQEIEREMLSLKIQYADAEIAPLLEMQEGEKVIWYRERQRLADQVILAISDIYLPFWFVDVIPELEQRDRDVYQLMYQVGKYPAQCTETVEIVQASSVERVFFELSPDDPAPLLKLQQQIFDHERQPLAVQFLTLRGDRYRLHYAFPLT